jgi:hypothetical protein
VAGADQIIGWVSSGVVALGGGKFLVDLITSRARGKKETAEGSAILVNSASEFARQLVQDQKALRTDFDDYRRRTEAAEARRSRLLRQHADWDAEVRAKLRELGADIPAAPPLEINTEEVP